MSISYSLFEFTKIRKVSEILKKNLLKGMIESVKQHRKKIEEDGFNELDNKLIKTVNNQFFKFY